MNNYPGACRYANKLADAHGRIYYVLLSEEPEREGKYAIADDVELETYYSGISENRILYCSADR